MVVEKDVIVLGSEEAKKILGVMDRLFEAVNLVVALDENETEVVERLKLSVKNLGRHVAVVPSTEGGTKVVPIDTLRDLTAVKLDDAQVEEFPRVGETFVVPAGSNVDDLENVAQAPSPTAEKGSYYRLASGAECIDLVEDIADREVLPGRVRMFAGNAVEYLWRMGKKSGNDWREECFKAANELFRAVTGGWLSSAVKKAFMDRNPVANRVRK